jgi:acyl-coenzyme A synthetase/AMP-(fatty) acid ligase
MILEKLRQVPADAPHWIVDHEPIALPAPGGQLRPADIADASARVATVLGERGLGRGEKCLVWLDSPTDVIVAYAAISALGAIPVLASPTLRAPVVRAMIAGVPDVTTLIATDTFLADAREALTDLTLLDWRDVAAEAPGREGAEPVPPASPETPFIVFHTSGTTNVPKLVEYGTRGMEFHARVQSAIHRWSRLRGYCALALSPVHSRTVVAILVALNRRAPLILLKDPDPANVAAFCERYRPEYLETHPNTLRTWQHLAQRGAFRSVRFFASGFDVIHPDTVQAMLRGSARRLPIFVEVYGQSETGAIAVRMHRRRKASAPAARPRRRGEALNGHSVGPRFPFCGVRIADEAGNRVPTGRPGRIMVRTPGRFSRYINRPDIPEETYRGRWWDTGDWGSKSRLGNITLIDRQIDKLSAARSGIAIEDILLDRFPDLLEVVVLESESGLQPVVSVRPGCEFSHQDWDEAVRPLTRMADPILIPDDKFPRTSTGKIQRVQLRKKLVGNGSLMFDQDEIYQAAVRTE